MAFTGVTNAHGPSPQPTACMSPSYSLMTATGSNHSQRQGLNLFFPRSLEWMGEQFTWADSAFISLTKVLHA